jgi:hypothetical protein
MGAWKHARYYTIELLDLVDGGLVDKDNLIRDLLGYLSESDVEDFMRRNDYLSHMTEHEEEA